MWMQQIRICICIRLNYFSQSLFMKMKAKLISNNRTPMWMGFKGLSGSTMTATACCLNCQKLHNTLRLRSFFVNPCSPEGFSQTYFPKGGCCTPLWIINTEGHITLNLLPVYRYGHPLSIDTKISTNHWCMTSLWRHNVSAPTKIEKWPFCV